MRDCAMNVVRKSLVVHVCLFVKDNPCRRSGPTVALSDDPTALAGYHTRGVQPYRIEVSVSVPHRSIDLCIYDISRMCHSGIFCSSYSGYDGPTNRDSNNAQSKSPNTSSYDHNLRIFGPFPLYLRYFKRQ